jgi:hypothetical protein
MQPVADVQRLCGASGSDVVVDGAIAAGENQLTLATAADFANGQGVWLPHAGPPSPLPPPPAPRVFVAGGPHGTDTYAYALVALDGLGGTSAGGAPGVLTTGPASLGGLGPDGSGQGQALYEARFLGISLSGPVEGARAYAVYRTQAPETSGLSVGFLGIYRVTNAPFLDYGQEPQPPPPGVPVNPPASPLGQSLVPIIVAGGGTTTLTLSAAATTAYAGPVYHDDTAALQLAYSRGYPALFHPPGSYGISAPLTYTVANGVLAGVGPASVLRLQGTAAAGLIVTGGGTTVHHLAFDGQQLAETLLTLAASHLTVADTTGQGGTTGVGADNGTDEWYRGLTLRGNVYTDCTYAFSVNGYWTDVVIADNRADFTDINLTGRAVNLHNTANGGHPTHWTVHGNVLRSGQHTAGIVAQGAGYGTITGNVVLVAGGIYGVAAWGDATYAGMSNGLVVADNYLEALWGGSGVAVYLDNMVQVTVDANVINRFGYAFQVQYPSSAGHTDAVLDNVRFSHNQLMDLALAPLVGPTPLAVQFIHNAGQNPLGRVAPPALPLTSGQAYQNTYGAAAVVYQPVYPTVGGVSGSVTAALGPTSTPPLLFATEVPGTATADAPLTVSVRVPAGWWYAWTVSGAVLLPASVIAD